MSGSKSSSLPGRLTALIFIALGVLFWPGVLETLVSLDWYVGNLRPVVLSVSVASVLLGFGCFVAGKRIDAAFARMSLTPRELVFRAILVGLSLLVTAGLIDGVLRFVGMPYPREPAASGDALAQFDAELGWAYFPNRTTVRKYGFDEREVMLHFDEAGLRVPSEEYRHDLDTPTLILGGGSFAMGHGLPYEDSFAGRLAAMPDFHLQVVNLGVQAYGTDQALLSLKRHVPRFNTQVVIYTFSCDHVRRNAKIGRRFRGTKPRFGLDRSGTLVLERKPLTKDGPGYSPLAAYVRLVRNEYGPIHDLELTRALVAEMSGYVQSSGGRFILLNWGSDPNCGERPFEGLEIEVVSTADHMPPAWNDWVIPGDGHPDARAHSDVATLLHEQLVRPEEPASNVEGE